MPIDAHILGSSASDKVIRQSHVHEEGGDVGSVVFSKQMTVPTSRVNFLINPTFGADLNQSVTFAPIATVIHDGGTTASADSGTADTNTVNHIIQSGKTFVSTCAIGMYATSSGGNGHITAIADTDLTCDADVCPAGNEAYTIDPVWTGAAVQGAWNFADSGKITITSANNDDEATFSAASTASYDMSNYTAFTGKVDLDTYSVSNHGIIMSFGLNGTPVGNSLNLNNIIDTGDFTEQSFVVPLSALGIEGENINELTISIERTGGSKPTIKFDDLNLETSGSPLEFKIQPERDEWYHLTNLTITMADEMTGTLSDASMPNLPFNSLLAVPELTNGILVFATSGREVVFSGIAKQLLDFMQLPSSQITGNGDDGTNVWVSFNFTFPEPLILKGDFRDRLSVIINDDLSGLLHFRASCQIGVEKRRVR